MFALLRRTKGLLLLPFLLLLGGCFVEDDSIAIFGGGLVSFQSVVTVEDPEKQLTVEVIDQAVSESMDELKKARWKVESAWLSRSRPYKLKFSGSGELNKVSDMTKFYLLKKDSDKQFLLAFRTPGVEGKKSQRSITFLKQPDSAEILDSAGKPVSRIETLSTSVTYTIKLR